MELVARSGTRFRHGLQNYGLLALSIILSEKNLGGTGNAQTMRFLPLLNNLNFQINLILMTCSHARSVKEL